MNSFKIKYENGRFFKNIYDKNDNDDDDDDDVTTATTFVIL